MFEEEMKKLKEFLTEHIEEFKQFCSNAKSLDINVYVPDDVIEAGYQEEFSKEFHRTILEFMIKAGIKPIINN